jgi:hypothetical protein
LRRKNATLEAAWEVQWRIAQFKRNQKHIRETVMTSSNGIPLRNVPRPTAASPFSMKKVLCGDEEELSGNLLLHGESAGRSLPSPHSPVQERRDRLQTSGDPRAALHHDEVQGAELVRQEEAREHGINDR